MSVPANPYALLRGAFLLAVLFLNACDRPLSPDPVPYTPLLQSASSVPDEIVPGRYIVMLNLSEAGRASERAVGVATFGGQVNHIFESGLPGFSISGDATLIERLRREPWVRYIEPVRRFSARSQPWHLDRIDQRELPLDGSNYRGLALGSGGGVTVYVLDSGLNDEHQEFYDNVAVVRIDTRFVTDEALGYVRPDPEGAECADPHVPEHGTAIASLIVGNGLGVAPGVRLLSLRILNCLLDSDTDDVLHALTWIENNHTDGSPGVLNLSGGAGSFVQSLDEKISHMLSLGFHIVGAAPNGGPDACTGSPTHLSQSSGFITVGRTDVNDWTHPTGGQCISLFAPGQGITAASRAGSGITTVVDGTSFATPIVAGVLARYLSEDANAAATPLKAKSEIIARSTAGILTLPPGDLAPNRLVYGANRLVSVDFAGPDVINTHGTYEWTAILEGGYNPTYRWWRSQRLDQWSWADPVQVGAGPTLQLMITRADPDFLLELEVASDTVMRKTKQILGPCGVPPNVCIQTIGGSTFE
jgi:aqualysin 1